MVSNSRFNEHDIKGKKLDLTQIRPYGDTLDDGKVQISFTLPVESGTKAKLAAKILAEKMGLDEPTVVHQKELDNNFTFFIIYGSLKYSVDFTKIKMKSREMKTMSLNEINSFIKKKFARKIKIIGATTGTDAHTMGLDAIMNAKGFAGHYGLESFEMLETYNLGSQVPNEIFIREAIEKKADALLISQTVTQKNIHIENLTNLVDLLEAEGIRDQLVLICGGSRITNELAKELGYDAGFGLGTTAELVASYIIKELEYRKNKF